MVDAIDDIAPVKQAASARNLTADQEVGVTELPCVDEPPEKRPDRNPALSRVTGFSLTRVGFVIELRLLTANDDVLIRFAAVVDTGLGDWRGACRRDIAQVISGKTVLVDLVDGIHDSAVTVGVLEMDVHPAPSVYRQTRERQFTRRQRYFGIGVVDLIAIHVDVVEHIQRTNLLLLLVRVDNESRVPQPNIVDRLLIGADCVRRNVRFSIEWLFLDRVETKGLARHLDVALDVRLFLGQLIGIDRKALDGTRIKTEYDDQHNHPGHTAKSRGN